MGKTEEFIQEHTRNCYNYNSYAQDPIPWLTPDDARKAVEIAKEEMLNEICEWIGKQRDLLEDSFSDPNDFADILRQEMKDE